MPVVRNHLGTWRSVRPYVYSGGTWRSAIGVWRHDGTAWRRAWIQVSSGLQAIGLISGTTYGIASFSVKGSTVNIRWDSATGIVQVDVVANVNQYWMGHLFVSKSPEISNYYSSNWTFTAWDGIRTRFTVNTGGIVTYTSGDITFIIGG